MSNHRWHPISAAIAVCGLATCLAQPASAGDPAGEAVAAAAAGKRFLACGSDNVGGDPNWIVEAYDARDGSVLWTDALGAPGSNERCNALVVKGKTTVAVGGARSPAGNDWLVRALDTKTGALLWEIAEPGAGIASHVAIKGKRVFVAGSRDNGIDEDFFVAAYSARTGALLWSDQQNPDAGDIDGASQLAVKGSLLVAVGSLRNGINTDWYVRAYRAKTGEFLWEERFDGDGSTDYASDVAIQGKRVFVAGSTLVGGDREFLVRAYDAKTGGELWSDLFDLAGGGDGASHIAVKGRRVFAAGQVDNGTDTDVLLRTFDAKTGLLLWDDLHDRAGGGENVSGLVVKGGRLYMSGGESNGLDGDAFVRVYATKSGFLESEDSLDLGGNERGNEIAVRGKTIFQAAIASEQYLVRILGLP